MKYRPSDYRGREGDESLLCLDPSRSEPIHSAFYQLIDTLSMDYRITETFRSKVRRNVRLREYYRQTIYIYMCIYIRSYLSAFFFSFFKRKIYVDITRLVIILVCAIICAKWTSKDEKKKKKEFEFCPLLYLSITEISRTKNVHRDI